MSGKTYSWERSATDQAPDRPTLGEIQGFLRNGTLVLLLLQADPAAKEWQSNQIPLCSCIAGDIYLTDALKPRNSSRDRLYNALGLTSVAIDPINRPDRSKLLAPISVHASGMTIFGAVQLPWYEPKLSAPFQLSQLIENGTPLTKFRLRPELGRLIPPVKSVKSDEEQAWIRAWQQLGQWLDPLSAIAVKGEPTDDEIKQQPKWATLQVNAPMDVPLLYWQLESWPLSDGSLQSHKVCFDKNAFRLTFSDQSPYDRKTPPSTLAQISPLVTIEASPDNSLSIKLSSNGDFQTYPVEGQTTKQNSLLYTSNRQDNAWDESIEITNLTVAFSSTQVAQFLRETQELPVPEWLPEYENDPNKVGSISAWQNILYGCGYLAEPKKEGSGLGSMDEETLETTKRFQKDLNKRLQDDLKLPETGEITLETWRKGLEHEKRWNWSHWVSKNHTKTISSPVVWGFMPLVDGWAQLPIPNLSEQLYISSDLTNLPSISLDPNTPGSVVQWQNILIACGYSPMPINGWIDEVTRERTVQFQRDLGLPQTGEVSEDTWRAGLKHKKLPGLEKYTPSQTTSLLEGAVSYGNNRDAIQQELNHETPWSVTVSNAANISGAWILGKDNNEYHLEEITLTLQMPTVTINGLLWLSTEKPTVEDALPDLTNWISGLQSIPLQTVREGQDIFPPVVELLIESLTLNPHTVNKSAVALNDWKFQYQVNEKIFTLMKEKGILPQDTFSRYLPLIWQRHPHLPMIQALPMTQSQSPPNFPCASRQLVPYELKVTEAGLPDGWRFESKSASTWVDCLTDKSEPAQEWKSLFDLPLVSLSLPGLVLSPSPTFPNAGLGVNTRSLYRQYRFDLPYTDEINALAQLPKEPRNPDVVSPLPDSPKPEPPKPLTRESLSEHWRQLSERASLAAADAVFGLTTEDGKTFVDNLIEPLRWEVTPDIDLSQYPGRLTLSNVNGNANGAAQFLELKGESALEGITGQFTRSNGSLQYLAANGTANDSSQPFSITAGSMAAYLHGESHAITDQRGLSRTSSQKDEDSSLLITSVKLENRACELATTLKVIQLQINDQHKWQLWFKDLPFQENTFDRLQTLSKESEDINDPEAHSREYNYLNGYEWRLQDQNKDRPGLPLVLFSLDFYPLVLIKSEKADGCISSIELVLTWR